MKTSHFITLLVASAVLAGCSRNKPQDETPAPAAPTNQVKESAQGNANLPQGQLAQAKNQAVAAMEKQLQSLDAKMDELANRSRNAVGAAKAEAEAALVALREKGKSARVKLEELKAASQDTWESVKSSFDLTVLELEKACDELKAKLSS